MSTTTPGLSTVPGSLTSPSIHLLSYGAENRWDDFIASSPDATFFHFAGWRKIIEETFGYRTFYLFAERNGVITGVLPLTYIKSRLFGSRLVSNACAMYGGPVAIDDESRGSLEAEAERLMAELELPVLELRSIKSHRVDWATRSDLYVTFRRRLLPTVQENLKAIPSGQRTIIRNRASQNQLYSELDDSIHRFYPIYAESVRNLGTPVYSTKYFSTLIETFEGHCDIVTVMYGREAVASSLNVYIRNEVMTLYVGGTYAARGLGANVFMFWEVMRRACERGYTLFDFGRSKVGTGSYTFKRNWGFQPTALAYQYKLGRGRSIPDQNPLNPKYRLLIATWKRLPLPLANVLGPPIVKGLG